MRVEVSHPDASRAARLQAVVRTERELMPFLVGDDGDGAQRLWIPEESDRDLWIGRSSACDVVLDWDPRLSRQHAGMQRVGTAWALSDDGLSRNGTWVGAERVVGRHRLEDGDVVRLGESTLVYRSPAEAGIHAMGTAAATVTALESIVPPRVTPAQLKVLVALCRPLLAGHPEAVPASNAEIADELVLSPDAVRTHFKALYVAFGLEDLPQAAKRIRLARGAIQAGIVTPRDI